MFVRGRRWTVVDEADSLAGRVVSHAPHVRLVDENGVELGDGAEEQTRARQSWNDSWSSEDGDVRTVGEVVRDRTRARAAEIGRRLFDNGSEEEIVGEEEHQDDSTMSEAIRNGARRGSPLSRALGARFATDTGEERDEAAEDRAAAESALEVGRARSRQARGLPSELEEEPHVEDMSAAIRSAVARRGGSMDRGFRDRLFGTDEAGDAGGEGKG
jgi:hypothetical protein